MLAFLTPLLPLAAPDNSHRLTVRAATVVRRYLSIHFRLDWKAIEETPSKLASVYDDLASGEKVCAES